MLEHLFSDSYRKNGRCDFRDLVSGLLLVRTHRPVILMRLCQTASRSWVGVFVIPFLHLFHKCACHLAGIDFSWKTKVGYGFAITHGWGIVINENASIGSNITVFHGVTIGQADKILPNGERKTGYPVIEDDVWIGPNAIIVGEVTIGKGSRIGGGAFVTKDIPPHSLVIGNPAVVVKSAVPPDVFNRYSHNPT